MRDEKCTHVCVCLSNRARLRVQECKDELEALDSSVETLKDEFANQTREAETLKISLGEARSQLEAAELLVGKLIDEKSRWETYLSNMNAKLKELPWSALIASAYLTYLCSRKGSLLPI